MKISEKKIKYLINESIKNNMIREGVAWETQNLQKFEFPHCDVSKFDPTFLKVLNLFKDTRYNKEKDYANNSFITNLANAIGSKRDFINPTFINTLNNLFIPGIEMMGKMPVGAFVICELLTDLSQKYSFILKQAYLGYSDDSNLSYMSNKDKNNILQQQQYYLNGLITKPQFQISVASGWKLFPYTVPNLSTKINERNVNGFDAIFFPMYIANTISTPITASSTRRLTIDNDEIYELSNFSDLFRNDANSASSHEQILDIFERSFTSSIVKEDTSFFPVIPAGDSFPAKERRMQVFVNYLKYDMTNLKTIFKSHIELGNAILKELNRMIDLTK